MVTEPTSWPVTVFEPTPATAVSVPVPVAVTDAGASRSVIDNGAAGLLLPDDETRWPAVLDAALRAPERLRALAAVAAARVRSLYSLDATLAAYEALYG